MEEGLQFWRKLRDDFKGLPAEIDVLSFKWTAKGFPKRDLGVLSRGQTWQRCGRVSRELLESCIELTSRAASALGSKDLSSTLFDWLELLRPCSSGFTECEPMRFIDDVGTLQTEAVYEVQHFRKTSVEMIRGLISWLHSEQFAPPDGIGLLKWNEISPDSPDFKILVDYLRLPEERHFMNSQIVGEVISPEGAVRSWVSQFDYSAETQADLANDFAKLEEALKGIALVQQFMLSIFPDWLESKWPDLERAEAEKMVDDFSKRLLGRGEYWCSEANRRFREKAGASSSHNRAHSESFPVAAAPEIDTYSIRPGWNIEIFNVVNDYRLECRAAGCSVTIAAIQRAANIDCAEYSKLINGKIPKTRKNGQYSVVYDRLLDVCKRDKPHLKKIA